MSSDSESRISVPRPREYGERTLKAARLYSLLRQECEIQDPWHIMVSCICAFEQLHTKDGWEFVLTHRRDIEDVGELFERSTSPEEFREGMAKLKEQDLQKHLEKEGPF